jgi:hypothetical protein
MKVGNGGFDAGGQDGLLDRMRKAHNSESEAVGKVDSASSYSAAEQASRAGKASEATGSKNPELETELLTTAADALEGKYGDDDEIRGAVVETIVDTRYGENLAQSERSRIVSTLEQTLVDDQEFRAEVDNMLILAARQLARN